MKRGPDAHVRLRTGHNELANAERRQHLLQLGIFKRVPITLLDNRLTCLWRKLGNDLPSVAACLEVIVSMLDPDNRHLRTARTFNECLDGAEDFITTISRCDDVGLKIYNDQCGIRTIN